MVDAATFTALGTTPKCYNFGSSTYFIPGSSKNLSAGGSMEIKTVMDKCDSFTT